MSVVRVASRVIATVIPTVAACSVADIPGTGAVDQSADVTKSNKACIPASDAGTLERIDLNTLKACECNSGGKAHCVAKSKIPENLSKQLAGCDGESGACVPDSVITSGGARPPTCKTKGADIVGGVEGRCVSQCVPKVAKYSNVTSRGEGDRCAEDERCIPCTLPDGASSGVCELGPAEACEPPPVQDAGPPPQPITCPFSGTEMNVSKFPECAPGGRCVEPPLLEDAIKDPKAREDLVKRLSTCATGLCVPEEYLKKYGQHKAKACSSFAGIEGRCFSLVFKDVGAKKHLLQQDACEASERCVPCFNPADGTPTGACTTVSCDAAGTTPPVLADCCRRGGQSKGKCVPKDDIPSNVQSRVLRHDCRSNTDLCMPTATLDMKAPPKTCTTDGKKGLCASECLQFRFFESLALDRENCDAFEKCVPCISPKTNEPLGLPGCE